MVRLVSNCPGASYFTIALITAAKLNPTGLFAKFCLEAVWDALLSAF